MRPAFEDQDHGQSGGTVHGSDPPSLTHPDVRLIRRLARDAVVGILAAPRRFDVDRWGQFFDPQVPLEGEGRPSSEVGQGSGVLGHAADPNPGRAALSRVNFFSLASRAVGPDLELTWRPESPPDEPSPTPKLSTEVIHRHRRFP